MKPSNTYTTLVLDAPAVNPKFLEKPPPSSLGALVPVDEAMSSSPPCVDDVVMCPDLVFNDGSQECVTPYRSCCANATESYPYLCSSTPQSYDLPSPPQFFSIDYGSHYSPSIPSSSPTFSVTRAKTKGRCAEATSIKQEDGYNCSICGVFFTRRDEFNRHIRTVGVEGRCKYCGKRISCARPSNYKRHLLSGKCLEAWRDGYNDGSFTDHSVEDAFN